MKHPHEPVEIGSTFRYDGYLYHVVLSFNDNGETFYVVKYYGKYRQWWHYDVWDSFEYDIRIRKIED